MVERCGYGRESEISHFTSSNSSFSSSLLDAIYRSIDQGDEEMVIYGGGMRKKSFGSVEGANVRRGVFERDEEMESFQRACMIEKWVEKKVSEKSAGRRKSVADFQVKKLRKDRESSSWSSSDSSSGGTGGFFSSSEAESFQVQRPKPIRTGLEKEKIDMNHRESEQKPKIEGGFSKTKLRALKIYGDLKKVKQPISPGGKLAGFLNSLFPGGKGKIGDESPILKSTTASTCSSASSLSRSCLSKTPSSRGNHSSAGAKRSTSSNRDAARNQSSKNSIRSVINEELMAHVMDQNRRAEEVARDLLRNYQRQNQQPQAKHEVFDRDFDDDDDAASCASSDLFELDNLSAIGMEMYREELPVYETTRLDSAGNGLIY
ncbi:hypothetical protein SASPL_156819 [Salvia splendens]|uniref:Protein BIG GRAIN 1-like B n=1 Tax=Salvia splendens TaxID=180675 RepID=A0A8X8YW54_SALSN|nr:hypothetical protein SASPL_156819 [Salvia splendens]